MIKNILKKNWFLYKKRILANLGKNSFLESVGWFDSVREKEAIDGNSDPIPWITYSSLSFIRERVTNNMSVFEYGSGNSTLWWADQVIKLVSNEHDFGWYQLMKDKIPNHVEYLYRDLEDDNTYIEAPTKYENKFDIIIIDGRSRVKCIPYVLKSLKEEGVIIFDNSEREKYREGKMSLYNSGFKCIDFEGMGPVDYNKWVTSIFYKSNNCFNI